MGPTFPLTKYWLQNTYWTFKTFFKKFFSILGIEFPNPSPEIFCLWSRLVWSLLKYFHFLKSAILKVPLKVLSIPPVYDPDWFYLFWNTWIFLQVLFERKKIVQSTFCRFNLSFWDEVFFYHVDKCS